MCVCVCARACWGREVNLEEYFCVATTFQTNSGEGAYRLIEDFDDDGDGVLNKNEFVNFMASLQRDAGTVIMFSLCLWNFYHQLTACHYAPHQHICLSRVTYICTR